MVPPTGLGSSAAPLPTPPGLQPTQDVPEGDGQGAAVGSRFETAIRDFIDSEVMLNFDYMSVDAIGDGSSATGSPAWAALCRDLSLFGYDLHVDDAWDRFGLCKMEGPAPDKALVLRRAGLLGDLLNSVADGPLTEPEREMKRNWISRATEAHQQCLNELKEVLRVRKMQKVAKDRLPRWAEAEPAVVEHLVHEAGVPCTCLLNLSRIIRARPPTAATHNFPSPEEARDVCGKLLQGGDAFLQTMATMAGRGVMLWAPGEKEDLGRLCGGVAKAAMQGVPINLFVVVPLDPRPGCHSPWQFGDTWTHDLLQTQSRWAPFVQTISFSHEPMKIVVSGLHAPMHQIKSLCMVHLSSTSGTGTWSMMRSRGLVGSAPDAPMVVLDIAEKDELTLLGLLGQVPRDFVTSWQGPAKAASSTPQERRLLYTGRLTQGGNWAARVSLLRLKAIFQAIDVIIGLYTTYSLKEAVLIDITRPAAVTKVQELLEDAVLVSPRLLLARTTASETQWRAAVDSAFQDDDDAYVERVRYRPSSGGGVLAMVPALAETRALRRNAHRAPDGRELQVVLRFSGELIGGRFPEVHTFMALAREAARLPLHPQAVEELTAVYQWKPLVDARAGWRGDVLLQVRHRDEVKVTFQRLEGKAIDVAGQGRIVIEVIPHVSLLEMVRAAGEDTAAY